MSGYDVHVFLNCPFDLAYKGVFEAIIFAIYDCGFVPRCALERDDASETRLAKVIEIIRGCRYGIHDISCTEPDSATGLPRFNMPLELGLYLGSKSFGGKDQRRKACLILDRERYRYRQFISDLAGQDIHAHNNNPRVAVVEVRNWLRTVARRAGVPGGQQIWRRYQLFRQDLPIMCDELKMEAQNLTFMDYAETVLLWLRQNP